MFEKRKVTASLILNALIVLTTIGVVISYFFGNDGKYHIPPSMGSQPNSPIVLTVDRTNAKVSESGRSRRCRIMNEQPSRACPGFTKRPNWVSSSKPPLFGARSSLTPVFGSANRRIHLIALPISAS